MARFKKPSARDERRAERRDAARRADLVRCDGCERVAPITRGGGEKDGTYLAPCPACGSETATYAHPLP